MDATATTLETDPEKDLDLFELKKEGQTTFWRLTPRLNREVFPFLSTLYQKVLRAQALPEDPTILSLEALRQGYHPLIKEYGKGIHPQPSMPKVDSTIDSDTPVQMKHSRTATTPASRSIKLIDYWRGVLESPLIEDL